MSKFMVGDKVAVYQGRKRYVSTINAVDYNDTTLSLQLTSTDGHFTIFSSLVHEKQCRFLYKKGLIRTSSPAEKRLFTRMWRDFQNLPDIITRDSLSTKIYEKYADAGISNVMSDLMFTNVSQIGYELGVSEDGEIQWVKDIPKNLLAPPELIEKLKFSTPFIPPRIYSQEPGTTSTTYEKPEDPFTEYKKMAAQLFPAPEINLDEPEEVEEETDISEITKSVIKKFFGG